MCDTTPCQNGGLCVKDHGAKDTTPLYSCACPAGWGGEFCTEPGVLNTLQDGGDSGGCTDWTTASCLERWAHADLTATDVVDCQLSQQINASSCTSWSLCNNAPTSWSRLQTRIIERLPQNGGQSCASMASQDGSGIPFCASVPCSACATFDKQTGILQAPRLPDLCHDHDSGDLDGCHALRTAGSCATGSDSPCALTNPCRQMDMAFRSNISGSGRYGSGCYPNGASADMQRLNCGTTAHAPLHIQAGTTEQRGIGNCNFEGPFCHLQASSTVASSCCNWAGGKSTNGYQGAPWPCYGYLSFLNRIHQAGPADTGLSQAQHDHLQRVLVAAEGTPDTVGGESIQGLSPLCSTYATTIRTCSTYAATPSSSTYASSFVTYR